MRSRFLIPLLLLISVQSCTLMTIGIGEGMKQQVISESGEMIQISFCPEDNCTKAFLDMIENSDDIRCALYDLDIPQIIEALEEKDAEVYLEEDNRLDDFGYGNSYALMHNKFCIFDKHRVMTGSFNPTDNGANKNNNNVVIIDSEYLSKNYLDEFDEIKNSMFSKGEKVQYPKVLYNNRSIENYFCPEDSCKDRILDELHKANRSVKFMFFSFTDKDIADEFIRLGKRGIDVQGLLEERRINMRYNQYEYLKENGIDVIPDNNPHIMHHKVFIIDNRTVITGSYNPTKSGNERNDENILIIHDEDVAKRYAEEYLSLTA